jgi:hypothetical protein
MKRQRRAAPRLLVALLGGLAQAACQGDVGNSGPPAGGQPGGPGSSAPLPVPTSGAGQTFDWSSLTAVQTDAFLRKIVPSVVDRVLTPDERAQIQSQKGKAIAPIIAAWVKEPSFVKSARRFLETSLAVSGKTPDGVNFDLPGNLVEFLVRNHRPWSQLITADTCYSDTLMPIPCDTGAPYTAGVITTRAYMISRISRYNLQRASALLRNFACRQYPMEEELQPHVEKDWLLPMFQAQSPEEQTDPRAKNGFGQGFACYTCHGQFSVHAQLFVKFAENGLWHADATGLQSPTDELGRSTGGLMASHFPDPARAQREGINIFGKPVGNLAEAARVIADSPTFVECAANRYLDNVLGVQSGTIIYNGQLFVDIAKRLRAQTPDPSFDMIAYALFTEPAVVTSIVQNMTGGAP